MKKKNLPKVALIYDFDGTLSPGNMQEFGFIQAIGKTPEEFWRMSDDIAKKDDASNVLSYMKLMYDEARKAGIPLRKAELKKFGKHIELFDGVKEWFKLVKSYGASIGVEVQHFINSSGLREIIKGSPIAGEFEHIFACSFIYDEHGEAVWPGVAVDYTAKTQFIFKINKGITSARDSVGVNESIPDDKKPIPFQHMIYFGDGQTDIPCMKIVKMFGGNAIAVYNKDPQKRKNARELLRQGRVNFTTPADYTSNSRAFEVVCAILRKIKAEYDLNQLAKACK